MESSLQKILKRLFWVPYDFYARVKGTIKGILEAPSIASNPQLIAGPRKNFARRLADVVFWAIRYGEPHYPYTLYGNDLEGSELDDFLDQRTLASTRHFMNCPTMINPSDMFGDKRLFAIFADDCGLPAPKTVGVIDATNPKEIMALDLSGKRNAEELTFPLFVKHVQGGCGQQVECVVSVDALASLELDEGLWILQEPVNQHEKMYLMGAAVNTLRIVTVTKRGGCTSLEPPCAARLLAPVTWITIAQGVYPSAFRLMAA